MWNPSVSVVMCTYNGAAFLEEQVKSILAQTYPITEFLVFDDGSSDESAAIIQRYCNQYSFIQFHQNKHNLGYNLNFEQALKAAACNVIAIADQDDYWHPEKLAKMIKAWKNDTLLIYCNSIRFSGTVPTTVKNNNPRYRRFEGKDARKLFLYNTISGHAMLLKRTLLPLILPFRNDTFYDWWTGVVAACNGGVSYLPETLVFQRAHDNNVTIKNPANRSRAQARQAYKKEFLQNLRYFPTAPNMPKPYQQFGNTFYQLWIKSLAKPFHWPLFFFLVKHRTVLFWSKKRKVSLLHYIKHSFRLTRNNKKV